MSLIALDREAVRQSFDRAAGSYDRFAVLQQEVASRLLERLEYIRSAPGRILDAGCGTGTALAEITGQFPESTPVALDWSRSMLAQARSSLSGTGGGLLCADMHELPLFAGSIDLVFSNLAVQWSGNIDKLFAEFRRVLRPGGLLMFTSFGPDTLRELRASWAGVDDRPHVNRFMDMHDIGDALVRAGFAEPVMDVDMLTLEYRDVLQLMRELKAIGAHNAAADRRRGLTGKNALVKVIETYESFRRDGVYPATYEVIYGLAFGPQEGQPVRGPEGDYATFSVDALRTNRRQVK